MNSLQYDKMTFTGDQHCNVLILYICEGTQTLMDKSYLASNMNIKMLNTKKTFTFKKGTIFFNTFRVVSSHHATHDIWYKLVPQEVLVIKFFEFFKNFSVIPKKVH